MRPTWYDKDLLSPFPDATKIKLAPPLWSGREDDDDDEDDNEYSQLINAPGNFRVQRTDYKEPDKLYQWAYEFQNHYDEDYGYAPTLEAAKNACWKEHVRRTKVFAQQCLDNCEIIE